MIRTVLKRIPVRVPVHRNLASTPFLKNFEDADMIMNKMHLSQDKAKRRMSKKEMRQSIEVKFYRNLFNSFALV